MLESVSCTNQVLTVIISGVVNLSDILDAQQTIDQSEPYKTKYYQLWRYENIEDVTITDAELMAIVDRTNRLMDTKPKFVVSVVADSPLMFGMARMYQLLAEGLKWDVGVFKTLAEADQWLQIHIDNTTGQKNT